MLVMTPHVEIVGTRLSAYATVPASARAWKQRPTVFGPFLSGVTAIDNSIGVSARRSRRW